MFVLIVGSSCSTSSSGGPCEMPCPDVWEPVCGEDGVTYANACEAACVEQASVPGECTDGCILEGAPRLLHQTTGNSATANAVRTPSGTLIVWEEVDDLSARVFSLALDDNGLPISGPHLVQEVDGSPAQPQVQHVQEDMFAVAWLQGTNPGSCGPLGLRLIDGGGVPLEDTVLAPGSSSLACNSPSVIWTGEHILAVANQELVEDEIQPSAYVYDLDEGFAEAPVSLLEPTVADSVRATWSTTASQLLLTRVEFGAEGPETFLLRADSNASVQNDALLFSAATRFVEPAVLPDGTPIVVWDAGTETRAEPSLHLGFVSGNGLGRTVDFSDGELGRTDDVSRLAVGTAGIAAAWSDDRSGVPQVYVSVSDFEGNRLTADLPVSGGERGVAMEPAVVATADGFAVIWRDTMDRPGGDLYARRIECR